MERSFKDELNEIFFAFVILALSIFFLNRVFYDPVGTLHDLGDVLRMIARS